jgi:hypothetical protein
VEGSRIAELLVPIHYIENWIFLLEDRATRELEVENKLAPHRPVWCIASRCIMGTKAVKCFVFTYLYFLKGLKARHLIAFLFTDWYKRKQPAEASAKMDAFCRQKYGDDQGSLTTYINPFCILSRFLPTREASLRGEYIYNYSLCTKVSKSFRKDTTTPIYEDRVIKFSWCESWRSKAFYYRRTSAEVARTFYGRQSR